MILETLKVDDRTCQSAHAILGVALLSLWHFELFSGYCLGLVLDEETPFRYEISAHRVGAITGKKYRHALQTFRMDLCLL